MFADAQEMNKDLAPFPHAIIFPTDCVLTGSLWQAARLTRVAENVS